MATDGIGSTSRYLRNHAAITKAEQSLLAGKRVGVCGCGGIGGYVVEMLARVGIGTLVLIDCDAFDETNLNRQLLSSEDAIGHRKVQSAVERVAAINSEVKTLAFDEKIACDNVGGMLGSCDIVIDALDSYRARATVEEWCARAGIVLIHGAIGGWCAQVSAIVPGSGALASIYPNGTAAGAEKSQGNPSFTPAFAASLEVAECIKVLTGKGEPLYGKLLIADLLRGTQRIIDLSR